MQVVEQGYRALKVVFIPYTHYTMPRSNVKHVASLIEALRQAVGDEVEIMIDFLGRCPSVSTAMQYIQAVEPYHPMFIEEPIAPGDTQSMCRITQSTSCPIAAGERLIHRHEFDPLFRHRAIQIAQPDLCHCGGLSEARKIASAAELAGIGMAPHNPLGPVAGVAALHFDIATPNFVIQEEMSGAVPWYDEVVQLPPQTNKAYWDIPDRSGLGVEINEQAAKKHPYQPEIYDVITEAQLDDGTIVDW